MSTDPVAVVVVSHNDANCSRLRRVFRRLGWSVRRRRALASLCRSTCPLRCGVVLTESSLPDGSWREVLAWTTANCPDASVVVMSEAADDELWADVLNRGGFDLVAAPLDEAELQRVSMSAWLQARPAAASASA